MQLIALLPLLASIAEARHLPLRRHRQNQVNKQHHQHARAMGADAGYGLDVRGLPITATTTVVVDMTSTQTVWVRPTGQVPMQPEPEPEPSASASASMTDLPSSSAPASETGSSSDQSVSTEAASPSPTAAPSDSTSSDMAASVSSSEWISSVVSASASASASDWSSSAISSESASSISVSEIDSASASPTSLSSWDEPSSSVVSGSASSTWSESMLAPTSSANATSIASASASGSVSDASSISQSDSLTEASYSSSSISFGSASPSASAASSATVSPSVSASADASASMSDWAASSSSSASVSASSSESAAASSASSSFNETSASASASSSSSAPSDQSSSSSVLPSSTSASISAASASPSSGHHLVGVPRTLMAGYYPDWSAWTLPPESVDWNKFDVVDFAFAIPTWDGRLEFTQWDSSDLLNRLVTGAHRNGKRVKLSIGGWTGSKFFSPLLADPTSRRTFVNNCVQAYWAYSLDGIDIDWEYPNSGGAQGNIISAADSANYLLFLQELRAALPSGAMISLATQVWPFAGPNGRPLSDVSGFAKVIDWIIIMNYDIWGSSDNPGPNAPLSDACGTSTQPLANAYAAVASWTSAGMPANKIVLGVPAYGYLQKANVRQLRTRDYIPPTAEEHANLTSSLVPIEKRQNGIVTVRNGGGGDDNGQLGFADLVKQGALALDSSGKYIGAGGFYREWDRCSSTPWIRSSHSGQVVTYDDPDSLSMKGQFALQSGLRGVNMFSMDGDWNGSNWPLTDSLRSGMGI